MSLILLFITIIVFVLYFYQIGLRYLGLLPFIIFVVLIGYYTSKLSIKDKAMQIIEKYGMFLAWLVIMAGIIGVAHFVGVDIFNISKGLVGLNLLLRLLSYFFNYKDGKYTFQLSYYLGIVFMLVYSLSLGFSRENLLIYSLLIVALDLGVSSFLVFVIGIKSQIEKYLWYKHFILFVALIFLLLIKLCNDIYIALFLDSVLLCLIYRTIWYVHRHKPLSESNKEEIPLRRILAGEKIQKAIIKKNHGHIRQKVYDFISDMPWFSKYLLESANIVLIVILMLVYIFALPEKIPQVHQILFWVIIILFSNNILLLKRLGYTSFLQKLVGFVVINFAIYATLFSVFYGDFEKIALGGILRNLASSILIFATPNTSLIKIFQKRDYMFWLMTILSAMILNIILLSKSDINPSLMFPVTLFYMGVQSMILYYALNFIKKTVPSSLRLDKVMNNGFDKN